eukprot:g22771.t1
MGTDLERRPHMAPQSAEFLQKVEKSLEEYQAHHERQVDNLCLEALGIVRVLTFGSRLNPSLEWRADAKLSNRAYDIEDHPCADLLAVLPSAMREIDKIMKSRQEKFGDVGDEKFEAKPKRGSGKEQAKGSEPQEPRLPAVLVHCASGISRSVAVCTAWLMLRQALELQEALQRVKKARPQALPNHGFVQCLQILEDEKGDLQAASKRWQKSNDISQNSRTRMVSKLRRKADDTAARAAKLEEELQGAQKGLDSPEGLAQLQLTVRRLRKLRKDIEQQRPRNTIDDAVASSAVTTFARCRKELTKATELLKEIKAGRLQQHEVGVAISSCAKSTRWPEAVELLRAVPLPNVVIYNATINACAKAQQWALAVQLLREMPERRLSPNVVSFSTAMSACRSQWQRCLQLLEALCEEAKPNSISFNAAINACVGRWQVTLQLLHEMDSRLMDPNLISFTGAMGACTTGSQWPKALSLFRQLRQWKHLPDLISWNAAMAAAEAGEI